MSEPKRVNIKAILADPVLKKEMMEGAVDFICKMEGIRPKSLSPAAQEVLNAYYTHADLLDRDVSYEEMLAAAIYSVADQVVPKGDYKSGKVMIIAMNIRCKLLAIADELKNYK